MTTRHTISHADELYAGNAFVQGTIGSNTVGSPDGRRGIPISHIYVREYGAVLLADDDGILCSYGPSLIISNALPHSTGSYLLAITTAGVTQLTLDVPRCLTVSVTSAGAGERIIFVGKDEYGQRMVETISQPAAAGTYSVGTKAFKVLEKIYTTWSVTSNLSVGVSNVLGLPYHLSSKGRFLSYYVDGMTPSGGATEVVLVTGLSLATDATVTAGDPDVRGTWKPIIAPDNTKVFTCMMLVDHSTRDKAYGRPQASTAPA